MSELSRVEDLLKTGVEEPVLPMSRLEAILRGEKITPQSRVEELLLQYNPSDILIEKRITANGTYFAVNDNADGYFKVVVDTPVVPPTVLDHLVETITENGLHEYTPTHDGFDTAAITVNVQPTLDDITITENGVYTSEHDGFDEVTVNVSGGVDDHIYLMDGQVPMQGTTYLEFDKAPINGYYVISIYANNKSINHMVYFETGRNSDSFNFSPGSSGGYNCYIMWDNNKATVRIACNSGSWYTMHVRVTRVDDNYILNS